MGALLSPYAGAQNQTPTPAPAHEQFEVIHLKYTDAAQSCQMLTQLLPSDVHKRVRTTFDARTNSLFIAATPEDTRLLKKALELLDQNRAAAPVREEQFKVFKLHNITCDQFFESGLKTVFPPDSGKFTLDASRNTVIVAGDEHALRVTEEFLKAVDVPRAIPRQASGQMRVRLVWLASGLARQDAAPPPRDLKKVTDELAALGIEDLHAVSQSIVNVIGEVEFATQGVAQLDYPCSLSINGQLQPSENENVLTLSIEAKRVGESKSPLVCKLSTSVRISMGQSVVLGVTPAEKATSVFVVQLLPE